MQNLLQIISLEILSIQSHTTGMWKEAPSSVPTLSLSSKTYLESSETHQIKASAMACTSSVTYTAFSTENVENLLLEDEEEISSKKMDIH